MRLERSKNAKTNLIFGLAYRAVAILFPFIIRTLFIKIIGEQYLGLNSLFSSILQVLSMAELGFNSAVVYNMYKPVADNDTDTICALLAFYRKVYRIIGCIIFGVGLLLIPFLPRLIKGTYPSDINLTVVYLISLTSTSLSYFMFAYLRSLISAYQREDIDSKNSLVVDTLFYLAQAAVIVLTKNYYIYAILSPVFTVINNIRIARIIRRMFPDLECRGTLDRSIVQDIKTRIKGLLIQNVCNVSRNSFDSIFVSAFLGLTLTAVYNNYYYIINSITMVLVIVKSAVKAGVGNSIVTDSAEKNYSDMNRMNFGYMWISGWSTICLLCLFQPFMKIWMGEKLMLSMPAVILFCLYFYVLKMGDIRAVYADANGLWWENRYRSILEVICNISLNYLLGKYFGVIGIISATLISLFFVNFLYGSTIVFKYYFTSQKISEYYLSHFGYLAVTAVIAGITYYICSLVHMSDWMTLIVRLVICALLPNIIYLGFYWAVPQTRESMKWLKVRISH